MGDIKRSYEPGNPGLTIINNKYSVIVCLVIAFRNATSKQKRMLRKCVQHASSSAVQSQKAEYVYLTSKQILSFG